MRIFLILFLTLSIKVYADTNQSLDQLTADTSPTSDDLTYTMNDPSGTKGDRKVTLSTLKTFMSASPLLVTPNIGVATGTSLTLSGAISASNLSGTNHGDQTTITGNAGTATALAANGSNCSSGNAPLGVDASGAVEGCFDVATQAELDAATAGVGGWTRANPYVALTTSSDNVGIGTANPVQRLEISGSAKATSFISSSATLTGSGANFGIGSTNPGKTLDVAGTFRSTGITQTGTTANSFAGTSTFSNATNSAFFTGGNVGVGTATANQTLDVQGTMRVSGAISSATWNGVVVGVAYGGTGLSSATDDTLMVGNGTLFQAKMLSDCQDSSGNHLNYNASTNAFSCGTTTSSGSVGWTDDGTTVRLNTSTDNVGIGTTVTPYKLTVVGTVSSTTFLGGDWNGTAIAYNYGGTGLSSAADDNTMVGSGLGWQSKALPDCDDASGQHLNYDTTTNEYSCGTSGAITGLTAGKITKASSATAIANSVMTELSSNIGIGSAAPGKTLDVFGDIRASNSGKFYGDGSALSGIGGVISGLTAGTLTLGVGTTSIGDSVVVQLSNNIGVGSAAPGAKLDVNGTVRSTAMQVNGTGTGAIGSTTGIQLDGVNLAVTAPKVTLTSGGNVGIGTVTAAKLLAIGSTGQTTVDTSGNIGTSAGYIQSGSSFNNFTGNVGIGSAAPGTALDVQGTNRMTGFQLTGNGASSGNVMVTNSVGVGTWMSPSSIGAGSGTITSSTANQIPRFTGATTIAGSSNMVSDGTNLGIGTTLPQSYFQIRDNSSTGLITARIDSTTGTSGWYAASDTSAKTPFFTLQNGTTDVSAFVACRTSSPPFTKCAQGDAGVGTPSGGGKFFLYTNGAGDSGITISATGNVGIGTTVPGSAFVVNACSSHAGQASCWTTTGEAGYCTSAVGAGGTCSCTVC